MLCPLKAPVTDDCLDFPSRCLLSSTNVWFLLLGETSSPVSFMWTANGTHYLPKNPDLTRRLYNQPGYTFDGNEWISKTIYWGNDTGIGEVGEHNATVWMTLCAVANTNSLATIEAVADWRADSEPAYRFYGDQWDLGGTSTEAIRKQFSNRSTLAERGVLNLTAHEIGEPTNFTEFFTRIRGPSSNSSFMFDSPEVEPIFWELLVDTFQHSGSIIYGLQTIFTAFTAREFYAQLQQPPQPSNFQTSTSQSNRAGRPYYAKSTRTVQYTIPAQVPTRNSGLITASGIVCLHFLSLVIIFWMYFTCRAPKFLDQSWQTLGELYRSPEAKAFLDETGNKGDLEVSRLPGATENWKKIVKITESGLAVKATDTEVLPGKCSDMPTPTSVSTFGMI